MYLLLLYAGLAISPHCLILSLVPILSTGVIAPTGAGIAGTLSILLFSTSGYFLLLLPPLVISFWSLQLRYRATSRELKRLDSTTRSPLLSQIAELRAGESVLLAASLQRASGLSSAWGCIGSTLAPRRGDAEAPSVRSDSCAEREAASTLLLLDSSQRATFSSGMASQWLALRLQSLGVAVLASTQFKNHRPTQL